MLRRHEIDVVYAAHILQFEHPLRQLLRREIEAVPLMRDVVVLTEYASQIATGKKHGAGTIVALNTGFFASMRRDCVDFDAGRADQAHSCGLVAVYIAEARAEITLT